MNLRDRFGLLPFTRREALEAGLSRHQWELVVKSRSLHKVRAGVYLAALDADPRVRHCQLTAAATKARSNHMACSGSALAILDLPNPYFKTWANVPITIAGPRSAGPISYAPQHSLGADRNTVGSVH